MKNLLENVKEILQDCLSFDFINASPETPFNVLIPGWDETDKCIMFLAIEEEFGIPIDANEEGSLNTINGIVELLKKKGVKDGEA